MDKKEARILLENLLQRIAADRASRVTGTITDREMDAIRAALDSLDKAPPPAVSEAKAVPSEKEESDDVGSERARQPEVETSTDADEEEIFEIDLSVLSLDAPAEDTRLCYDFGTAMSKATLVYDERPDADERIEVLKLGIPGNQEQISEDMLVSSVYIDNAGTLWFGQEAVELSEEEEQDGERQRLDSIKRWISEDDIDVQVGDIFNPTSIPVTYSDMVLAYLMFMTWCVNSALEDSGYRRNTLRRFAIPCFEGERERTMPNRLAVMLGEAQVLADTFFQTLPNGVPLEDFLRAVAELRSEHRDYHFVAENITEPLGVAGSIISWTGSVNTLAMVVDVGAGTTDFSLFRIRYNPETKESASMEVGGSARCISEAGDFIDRLLMAYILHKGGITAETDGYANFAGALNLKIREYKETLFTEESVTAPLWNNETVDVDRKEFLALESVQDFGKKLSNTMKDILRKVDKSWLKAAPFGAIGVALSGGGASLPMVRDLAGGSISVQGVELKLIRKEGMPEWMAEHDEYVQFEEVYPRIAVSLGGARKQVIKAAGKYQITAGDVRGRPSLDGYYTKGL